MKPVRAAAYDVKNELTYEDKERFIKEIQYDILIDQTHLIGMEFKMIDQVLKCSSRRNWCFVSPPPGFQYICSDDPVVLSWIDDANKGPYPPGHCLMGTIVFFPLCSELLLMGTFEDLPKHLVHRPDQVVAVNTFIAQYATRQIYARDGSFLVNLRDRDNVRGEDLEKFWKD